MLRLVYVTLWGSFLVLSTACGVSAAKYRKEVARGDLLMRQLNEATKKTCARPTPRDDGCQAALTKAKVDRDVALAGKNAATVVIQGMRATVALLSRMRSDLSRRLALYRPYVLGFKPVDIKRAFDELDKALHACASRSRSPLPSGQATAYLTIGAKGRARQVVLHGSPYPKGINRCLTQKLRQQTFATPLLGLAVTLRYKVPQLGHAGPPPQRPGRARYTAQQRRRQGCAKDSDCVISCRAAESCCPEPCICTHVWNKLFDRKLARRRCRHACAKGNSCPLIRRRPEQAICDQGLCRVHDPGRPRPSELARFASVTTPKVQQCLLSSSPGQRPGSSMLQVHFYVPRGGGAALVRVISPPAKPALLRCIRSAVRSVRFSPSQSWRMTFRHTYMLR